MFRRLLANTWQAVVAASRQNDYIVIDTIFIALLWCLAIVVVNPFGDFPLNDDWSFGFTVKRLLAEKAFRPIGWTSMPLITHALWGSLFCIPYGFSFSALRISSLCAGLMGTFGFYLLLRCVQTNRQFAVVGALVLAFNPIYFALSHTFMTDITFTVLFIFTFLFFIKSLLHHSIWYLIIGSGFAVAATLCRQLGVALPVAFGLIVIAVYGLSPKYLLRAGLPMVASIGSLVGFQAWLQTSWGLPALYDLKSAQLLDSINRPFQTLFSSFIGVCAALLYLGLFLAPLLLFIGYSARPDPVRVQRVARNVFLLFLAGATLSLLFIGQLMPLKGNILVPQGIGPLTLRDTYILDLPHIPTISSWFWLLVTGVSILSAGILLSRLTVMLLSSWGNNSIVKRIRGNVVTTFCLAGAALYFLPIAPSYFDRYLLPLIPLLITGFVSTRAVRHSRAANAQKVPMGATLLLFAFIAFSVMSTRDYLAWNRTRWVALRTLIVQAQIQPSEIDGGFEFNGWYLYQDDYVRDPAKSWWWVRNDSYVITSGELENYEVVQLYAYRRWLPPGHETLYVLQRNH